MLAMLTVPTASAAEGKPFKALEDKIDQFIGQSEELIAAIEALKEIEAKASLQINAIWAKITNQEERLDVLEGQVATLENNTVEAEALKAQEKNTRLIDNLRDANAELSAKVWESERKMDEVLEQLETVVVTSNNATFTTVIYEVLESNYSECMTGTIIGGGAECGDAEDAEYRLRGSKPVGNGWGATCSNVNFHNSYDTQTPKSTYAICLEGGTLNATQKVVKPKRNTNCQVNGTMENVYRVEDIHAMRYGLEGQTVTVCGAAIRTYTTECLDASLGCIRSYIQDGTGDVAEGTHALQLLYDGDPAPMGDKITVTGTVRVDMDLSPHYFDVILTDASVYRHSQN
jgi:hypothetical protein